MFRAKSPILTLAFFWSVFLSLGILIARLIAPTLSNDIANFAFSKRSFGSLILFQLIILTGSIIFIQLNMDWGIFILASFRAITYGFIFGITFACFGNAAWLYVSLCYTFIIFSVILDLWLWFIGFTKSSNNILLRAGLMFSFYLLTIIYNTYVADPFVLGLL